MFVLNDVHFFLSIYKQSPKNVSYCKIKYRIRLLPIINVNYIYKGEVIIYTAMNLASKIKL